MQLEHSFTVPVGVEQAWDVLLDIERIAPCMPGAAIESVDGDDFTGSVKVKLGPINLTYKGKASFVEKDVDTHRAVIDARGKDARGSGTASAKITATLTADGEASTEVTVLTDLDITGKPAQFGRGVMVDVGNKLIGQFADCLAGKLGESDAPVDAGADAPAAAENDAVPAPTDGAAAGDPVAAVADPGAAEEGASGTSDSGSSDSATGSTAGRHAADRAAPGPSGPSGSAPRGRPDRSRRPARWNRST